jgi:hypothetical protein
MQPMLQSMASNPDMARLLVENNPQLANNPEMREQVMRALPNMMSQVKLFKLFIIKLIFFYLFVFATFF